MYREGESASASERETETGTEKDRERMKEGGGNREGGSITRASNADGRADARAVPGAGMPHRALHHP